jgi:hypothetical protein
MGGEKKPRSQAGAGEGIVPESSFRTAQRALNREAVRQSPNKTCRAREERDEESGAASEEKNRLVAREFLPSVLRTSQPGVPPAARHS